MTESEDQGQGENTQSSGVSLVESASNVIENLKDQLHLYTKYPSLFFFGKQFSNFKENLPEIKRSEISEISQIPKSRVNLEIKIPNISLPRVCFIEITFYNNESGDEIKFKVEAGNKYYDFFQNTLINNKMFDSVFILFSKRHGTLEPDKYELLNTWLSSNGYNLLTKNNYLVITKENLNLIEKPNESMKDLGIDIGEINNIGGLDDCMILKNNDSSGIYFFTDLDYYNINIKRLS